MGLLLLNAKGSWTRGSRQTGIGGRDRLGPQEQAAWAEEKAVSNRWSIHTKTEGKTD